LQEQAGWIVNFQQMEYLDSRGPSLLWWRGVCIWILGACAARGWSKERKEIRVETKKEKRSPTTAVLHLAISIVGGRMQDVYLQVCVRNGDGRLAKRERPCGESGEEVRRRIGS
jgi:hypothetical protein